MHVMYLTSVASRARPPTRMPRPQFPRSGGLPHPGDNNVDNLQRDKVGLLCKPEKGKVSAVPPVPPRWRPCVRCRRTGERAAGRAAPLSCALLIDAAQIIVFYNMLPNGEIDHMSLHGGCPVIAGEKWAANKWCVHAPHTRPAWCTRGPVCSCRRWLNG
jgi:hypothetical protein